MHQLAAVSLLAQFVLALFLLAGCEAESQTAPAGAQALPGIAAGGLVEPQGEERTVIPEFTGRLKKVYVEEGDTVAAGQLLAEIENAEYAAAVAEAKAQVASKAAQLAKLKAGARPEEKREAQASLAEAEAQAVWARAELKRVQALVAQRQLSASALDAARHGHDAAEARGRAALERLKLLEAGSRAEDLAIAEAELAAGQAALARAEALYAKTLIRSPVDGIVLRRELREGETVVALNPIPLAHIGDMRKLYVRADIDELDISRVRLGQKATVSSDAWPGHRYAGELVRLSRRMGKRSAVSDDPKEKRDAKVLEALIALEGQPPLPVGLRVDVQIEAR